MTGYKGTLLTTSHVSLLTGSKSSRPPASSRSLHRASECPFPEFNVVLRPQIIATHLPCQQLSWVRFYRLTIRLQEPVTHSSPVHLEAAVTCSLSLYCLRLICATPMNTWLYHAQSRVVAECTKRSIRTRGSCWARIPMHQEPSREPFHSPSCRWRRAQPSPSSSPKLT